MPAVQQNPLIAAAARELEAQARFSGGPNGFLQSDTHDANRPRSGWSRTLRTKCGP